MNEAQILSRTCVFHGCYEIWEWPGNEANLELFDVNHLSDYVCLQEQRRLQEDKTLEAQQVNKFL